MFIVRLIGSVAERLKAPVLKTGDPKGFQSSNLCASAKYKTPDKRLFGVFCFVPFFDLLSVFILSLTFLQCLLRISAWAGR